MIDNEPDNSDNSDDGRSGVWCKTDTKPSNEYFLGTTGLSIITNNPEPVVEVVSAIIGEDLIQLFTEQANQSHTKNANQWKVWQRH
jgi:hypothetical protein